MRKLSLAFTGHVLLAVVLNSQAGTMFESAAAPGLGAQTQLARSPVHSGAVIAAFASWAERYSLVQGDGARNESVAQGLALAKARRTALLELFRADPEQALKVALPKTLRRALPAEIARELEVPVSGVGDLTVLCALQAQNGPPVESIRRLVSLGGQSYRAFVYGRRWGQTTKIGIPLHGIAIDDSLVLDEKVLRQLDPADASGVAEPVIDVGQGSNPQFGPTLAGVAGRVYRFGNPGELERAEARLEAAEAGLGPIAAPFDQALAPRTGSGVIRALAAAPPWTLGSKNVLIIRVDFSDLPGDPGHGQCTAAYVQQVMDTQVGPYFQQSSYGLTTLNSTATVQLYRMPLPAAHYAAGYNDELQADAERAAAADYALADFDRIAVLFPSLADIPGSQVTYGGLGTIGGSSLWVNGEFDFRVVAHELGHTYGLYHADLWQVNDGNPISDSGASSDYGDLFDTMSGNWGNDLRTDFNPWFKYELKWIGEDQVQTVTESGIYRVNRFDSADATGTLALKVAKDGARDYWISCRRNFTDNPSMQHGAYIIWGYPYNQHSDLLDLTTPGSNVRDAALAIGASLVDSEAGLAITPVAEGGSPPNEYLDVQVIFGQVPPIMTAAPSGQWAVPGQTAVFVAGAVGIPVPAFQWERLAAGSANWVTLNDGGDYGGCSTSTLLVAGTSLLSNGDQFRCVFSNAAGSTTSTPAVLRVVTSGVVTLAGQPGALGYADGIGKLARFNLPQGIAVDSAGNVYVADTLNSVIRKISPTGAVSTLAGLAGAAGAVDGAGSYARFNQPSGIALDARASMYVTDAGSHTIRKITPAGVVTTLAGLAGNSGSADGPGDQARFYGPAGIAVDTQANLYVADEFNCTIRKLTPEGVVTTLAGIAGKRGAVDGNGTKAQFNYPLGIAVDPAGNVYVADQGFCTVRKITPAGVVSTLAGVAGVQGNNDGLGSSAQFNYPAGLAVDASGNLYVADQGNFTIRKITPAGVVSTMAGVAGSRGSEDGADTEAHFADPFAVAVDGRGHLYVSDTGNSTIRLLQVATFAVPDLHITLSAGQVIVYWPAWASDFTLEASTGALTDPSWVALTNGTNFSGAMLFLTNTIGGEMRLYRLYRAAALQP